jgi:hypothetical protein
MFPVGAQCTGAEVHRLVSPSLVSLAGKGYGSEIQRPTPRFERIAMGMILLSQSGLDRVSFRGSCWRSTLSRSCFLWKCPTVNVGSKASSKDIAQSISLVMEVGPWSDPNLCGCSKMMMMGGAGVQRPCCAAGWCPTARRCL